MSFNEKDYYYDKETHRSLEEYLRDHDGFSVFPLFKGYEMFEILIDEGYTRKFCFAKLFRTV